MSGGNGGEPCTCIDKVWRRTICDNGPGRRPVKTCSNAIFGSHWHWGRFEISSFSRGSMRGVREIQPLARRAFGHAERRKLLGEAKMRRAKSAHARQIASQALPPHGKSIGVAPMCGAAWYYWEVVARDPSASAATTTYVARVFQEALPDSPVHARQEREWKL